MTNRKLEVKMARRKINKQNGGAVKGVDPNKSYEKEFERLMRAMVEGLSSQWKKGVLLSLNDETVEQFSDAKRNYAATLLSLNESVRKKLLKRFSNKALRKAIQKVLSKVNSRNAKQFYSRIEDAIGISSKELMSTEGLSAQIDALELETVQWAKKLRDETLEMYVSNSLRTMAQGGSLEDVLENFNGMQEKRKNHAKTVARTQISTFNSLVGKARAQNLGLKKAKWVTSHDERVRRCHQVRDGKEFDLDKGLYSSCDGKYLLPGVDYNCRCTYEYVIPEEDES